MLDLSGIVEFAWLNGLKIKTCHKLSSLGTFMAGALALKTLVLTVKFGKCVG